MQINTITTFSSNELQQLFPYASVRRHGAVGNGIADDTAALQSCADDAVARGVPMWIDKGVYMTRQIMLQSISGLRVCGPGVLVAMAPAWPGGIFTLNNCRDCDFSGVNFDTNQQNMEPVVLSDFAKPKCVGVMLENGCIGITIDGCTFHNLYMGHVHSNNVSDLRITNNTFTSRPQNQTTQCDFITHATGTRRLNISGNSFRVTRPTSRSQNAGGIIVSGHHSGKVTICDNLFEGVGRDNTGSHRVGVIDFYANMENAIISGNVSLDTHHMFLRLSSASNVVVRDNHAETSESSFNDVGFVQINPTQHGPARNIQIINNTFLSSDPSPTTGYCFNVSSMDWSQSLENVSIENNVIEGWRFGMSLVGSYHGLRINGNRFNNTNFGIIWSSNGVIGDLTRGELFDLDISHNTINNRGGGGIGLPLPWKFDGRIGGTNTFIGNSITSPGTGMNVNTIDCQVRQNRFEGCAIGFYPRGIVDCQQTDNVFSGCKVNVQ